MNISEKRMDVMFDRVLSYIYEHNDDPDDYAEVLKQIGFTKAEILNELTDSCGFDPDDMEQLVDELFE